MTKRRFRAAAVQTLARLGDFDYNIALATQYVEDAVRQGAELIVFPECMDTGYLFDSADHCRELAETVTDGPFVTALSELSRKHGVYIASGITEWDPAREKIFNSGIMFDRSGKLACHYHKQFLATHDQNWFSFGERGCPVVDTDLGRIGLLICFDGRIPEIFRAMAMQGAEVIVDMANFFAMDQADMWGPARSYENGVWLVAATKAGYERSIYYPGGSMIVDPKGRVLSKVPYDTHGMSIADIDLDAAADKSIYAANDKIADRRPETYGIMALPYETDAGIRRRRQAADPVEIRDQGRGRADARHRRGDGRRCARHGRPYREAGREGSGTAGICVLSGVHPQREGSGCACRPVRVEPVRHRGHRGEVWLPDRRPDVERAAAGLYVTTVLVGPDGKEIGRYRKTHLTAEERKWAVAGFDYPVFDTPFGRIGVMSGYDAVFPETSRCLAIGGADIILWPAALREPFERELLAVPRAEDNRVAVVLANRTDCPYPGGSVVIPPNGFPQWDINVAAPRVLKLGAVMPKHIDLALCRQKLMIPKVDMFANRLVETYAPIVAA